MLVSPILGADSLPCCATVTTGVVTSTAHHSDRHQQADAPEELHLQLFPTPMGQEGLHDGELRPALLQRLRSQ